MTETVRDQRDWVANVTTLSGDIGASGNNADNAYHVVNGSGGTNTAVLDGFTVTQGNANAAPFYPPYEFPDSYGGGMYNESSSPTVRNTIFSANSALSGGGMANEYSSPALTNVTFSANSANEYNGGGMYNDVSSPTIRNTIFTNNSAKGYGGGMYNNVTFAFNSGTIGGGMDNVDSAITLTNVTFNANSAIHGGGGIDNENSAITLTNVTFSANSVYGVYGQPGGVHGYGGGMNNFRSKAMLTNVTFSANSAPRDGGGMSNGYSSLTLTNVTFSANSASEGYGGGMYNYNCSSEVQNSILWGNTAFIDGQIAGTLTISDSVVQGGYPGGSNIITTDPRLGPLGDYGGSTPTIPLLPGSSAVDAVNAAQCPATDQRGIQRPQGAACDLGAFEARAMLAIIVVGDGTVTSQPAGINCPTDLCAMDYAPGTVVTLTATPHSGSPFVWGGAYWGSAQCVVTLTAAQVVIATFTSNLVYLPIMHR